MQLCPRRRSRPFARLRGTRQPDQADQDAVLAEATAPADRTRTGADELTARRLEPHVIPLCASHSCPHGHLVPLERPHRADLCVLLAALEGALACEAPECLQGQEFRERWLHLERNLCEPGDEARGPAAGGNRARS